MIYPIPEHDFLSVYLSTEALFAEALAPLASKFGIAASAANIFSLKLKKNGAIEVEVPRQPVGEQYSPEAIRRNLQISLNHIQHAAIGEFQSRFDKYITNMELANYAQLAKVGQYNERVVTEYANYTLYFRENAYRLWQISLCGSTNGKNATLIVNGAIESFEWISVFHPDVAFRQ
jgi:hypothetical protein